MSDTEIDTTIPDFLDRKLHPELTAIFTPKKVVEKRKKLSPREERELEIRSVADRRWRTWSLADGLTNDIGEVIRSRPTIYWFRRKVRAEFEAKGY